MKKITPDEALQKMERYCAFQERSPAEVRRKLAELQVDPQTAGQIWMVLEGEGYVNEERFAAAFVLGKLRSNHWGRVRIVLELRRRGISEGAIDRALQSVDAAEYLAIMRKVLERKQAQFEGQPRAREKVLNYMQRQGFELDLVFDSL